MGNCHQVSDITLPSGFDGMYLYLHVVSLTVRHGRKRIATYMITPLNLINTSKQISHSPSNPTNPAP